MAARGSLTMLEQPARYYASMPSPLYKPYKAAQAIAAAFVPWASP